MANRKFDIQLKDKSRNLLYPLAHKDSSGNVISSTYVKKSGDTMSGLLTLNKSLKVISNSNVNTTYRKIITDITSDELKAIDPTLNSTTTTDSDYFKVLLMALCVKYPNTQNYVYEGRLIPNSNAFFSIFIYDTSLTNSEGLPEHSFGYVIKYNYKFKLIGTISYAYYFENAPGSNINSKVYYGTCSSSSSSTTKAVDCYDFRLTTGATILVTFGKTNTVQVANITLNVNNTGDKPIKCFRNGALYNLPGAGYLAENQTYLFSYDGTNWVTLVDYNTNNNVLQTLTTSSESFPLLLAPSGQTTTTTTSSYFSTLINFVPSRGELNLSGSLNVGVNGDTRAERQVNCQSGAGKIYLYSQASTSGKRGIWLAAHGTDTDGKSAMSVDTNNNVTFNGSLNGHASNDLALTGGTLTGDLKLQKTTTIAQDYPATLTFTTVQTDNNVTTNASIKVYDDHDSSGYGTNMVIQSNGAIVLGGGESPGIFYSEGRISSAESLYLVSDSGTYIYTGATDNNQTSETRLDNMKLAQSIDNSGRTTFLSYGSAGFYGRNISFGTDAPSGGDDGDIYVQYTTS